MRWVGYGRLSTREQATGQSRDAQLKRLQDAGAAQVFWDTASGSDDHRPELLKALAALEQGEADGLIVSKLDRLTRSASFNSRLCDLFGRDDGPQLRALDDSVDTGTVMGRAMFRISGVFAQAEVERIRERTRQGLEHRRDVIGAYQGRAPFGYCRRPGAPQLSLDPATSAIAVETVKTFIRLADARATAQWLLDAHGIRIPPRSLRQWLQLPTLVGDSGRSHPRLTVNGKREPAKRGYMRIDPDTHAPLITRAMAADVHRALAASASTTGGGRRGKAAAQWFSSRFRCSCGQTMRQHRTRLICSNGLCPVRYGGNAVHLNDLRAELLRGMFWLGRSLVVHLAPRHAAASEAAAEPPEVLEIRRKIAALQGVGMTEVAAVVEQLEGQLTALLARSGGHQESVRAAARRLEQAIGTWRGLQRLGDDDLLALLRDADVAGVVTGQRLRMVQSRRWEMAWVLDCDGSDLVLSRRAITAPKAKGAIPEGKAEVLPFFDWGERFAADGEGVHVLSVGAEGGS